MEYVNEIHLVGIIKELKRYDKVIKMRVITKRGDFTTYHNVTAFGKEKDWLIGYKEGEWINLWGSMGFSKGVGAYEGRIFPQVVLYQVDERETSPRGDDEGGYITDEEDVPL